MESLFKLDKPHAYIRCMQMIYNENTN